MGSTVQIVLSLSLVILSLSILIPLVTTGIHFIDFMKGNENMTLSEIIEDGVYVFHNNIVSRALGMTSDEEGKPSIQALWKTLLDDVIFNDDFISDSIEIPAG